MSVHSFRTVVKGLIGYEDEFLIGKKQEEDDHPIGGEWHLLGGHLECGEDIEAGVKRSSKKKPGCPYP